MKMCSAYTCDGHDVSAFVSSGDVENPSRDEICSYYSISSDVKIKIFKKSSSHYFNKVVHRFIMPMNAGARRPDFVHTRNLTTAWGCARYFRLPVIYEAHDAPDRDPKILRLFSKVIASKALLGLVTITEALADHLQQFVPGNLPVLIAPDGVDQCALASSQDKEISRRHLDLGLETRRIAVYTGHLYPGRGIELIMEIAPRLHDYLFLLVGGTEQDLARWRSQTSALDNVRFPGFCAPSEVCHYQRAADVLLMPYADRVAVAGGGGNTAPFASPLKMFEYMAAGQPILSSQLPVLREIIEHDRNALMLPYDDAEAWVGALRQLSSDPVLGNRLGSQARLDVERYTWESRARNLIDFVGSVAERKRQYAR
ncbi:MAG: glycosyltransferase family 4 protein [Desulfuromonadales bacterium]|nr:glycosyltransferase family 4 protein [Desulfuromonadales bacterium]